MPRTQQRVRRGTVSRFHSFRGQEDRWAGGPRVRPGAKDSSSRKDGGAAAAQRHYALAHPPIRASSSPFVLIHRATRCQPAL